MTKEERNFEKVQDEAIELIKNKKGKHMKNIKEPKAPKTFTTKQIVKAVISIVILLSIGAFAGITIQSAINSHIESRVSEQVKSFTTAVEVKK
jgi:hypothetical protein